MSGTPGTSAVAGSGLQGDFRIGYYKYGLLQAAFMFGLLLGCPVFSALAKSCNPFKLIGSGLGCWTLATMGCGLSPGYAALFACRMLVGRGGTSAACSPPDPRFSRSFQSSFFFCGGGVGPRGGVYTVKR